MPSKAETETVIRWDRETPCVNLWTADAVQARRWAKAGYAVTAIVGSTDGRITGWRTTGPAGCVRLRRLRDGQIVKRTNGGQNPAVQRGFGGRSQRTTETAPTSTPRRVSGAFSAV